MKRAVMIVMVFLSLMAAPAANAAISDIVGYEIIFRLDNGREVQIGANNNGGGYARTNQDFVGSHIGIDGDGAFSKRVFLNTNAPVAETAYIWNNGPTNSKR